MDQMKAECPKSERFERSEIKCKSEKNPGKLTVIYDEGKICDYDQIKTNNRLPSKEKVKVKEESKQSISELERQKAQVKKIKQEKKKAPTNEKGSDVKYRLASAMGVCMKTAPVESITVREITDCCGVSRQTFYRNFLDKYDLINWYFDKLLAKSFDQMGKGRTITESLILKFDYIREERHFFTAAFRNDDQNNLREHDFDMIFAFYRNLIKEKTGAFPTREMDEILEMYCWAQIYRTVKWVLGGMKMSSKELAQMMVNAMPQPIEKLFRELNILE